MVSRTKTQGLVAVRYKASDQDLAFIMSIFLFTSFFVEKNSPHL